MSVVYRLESIGANKPLLFCIRELFMVIGLNQQLTYEVGKHACSNDRVTCPKLKARQRNEVVKCQNTFTSPRDMGGKLTMQIP